MPPETDASLIREIVAGVAALKEVVQGVKDNLEQAVNRIEKNLDRMGQEAKDERIDATRHREQLQSEVRELKTRLGEVEAEGKHTTARVDDVDRRLTSVMPHIETAKSDRAEQDQRKSNRWGLWVAVASAIALVIGEAMAHHFNLL